jgi:hypothetical protein
MDGGLHHDGRANSLVVTTICGVPPTHREIPASRAKRT